MSEIYEPTTKFKIIKVEPDNRLLELAQISKADFIITGNTNDFTMDQKNIGKNINNAEALPTTMYKQTHKKSFQMEAFLTIE